MPVHFSSPLARLRSGERMRLLALLRQSAARSYARCNIHCSIRILTPHSGMFRSAFGATRLMKGLHQRNLGELIVEFPSVDIVLLILQVATRQHF